MNVPFYIAKRYLFAKKSANAVNLITSISVLGVAIGTAAMIAVLSGFNGLESLIRGFYNTFDPDLKIEALEGKYLAGDSTTFSALKNIEGVHSYSLVLEDKALFKFRDKEYIATIKGVDQNYTTVTQFENTLTRGELFADYTENAGVFGVGVAYYLNISRIDFFDPVQVFVPRQNYTAGSDPMQSVHTLSLFPVATFSVQPDYDVKYAVTPLHFAQNLFERNQITSVEVRCKPGFKPDVVKNTILQKLGDLYTIANRNEQQATIFRVIKMEGLATFLILSFILAIASFGILGSLIMLILDKKADMYTLRSMGATTKLLQRIFLIEGLLISALGCFIGLTLGTGLVLLQQQFGLVSLGQGYAIDAYPMQLHLADVGKVAATVMGIGSIVSWLAVRKIKA